MSNKTTKNIKQLKEFGVSKIAVLSVLIVGGLITFGCSNASPNPAAAATESKNTISTTAVNKTAVVNTATPAVNSPPEKVPVPFLDAGEYGENIYDLAKAKNWTKAAEKLHELKQSQTQLATANIKSGELDAVIAALDKDVTAKDKTATLRDANQVTFVVADLTAKYNPPVPIEVIKLDYYGRELEIWSIEKDEAKLKSTSTALSQTWNAVKPKVEAKGGTKEVQNFEALVAKVVAANNVSDYAKVATPILDEVDNLEKVFEN